MSWRTGRPPEHGYYLGAWKRHGQWAVSELWFNPGSTGGGWWSSRGYFHEHTLQSSEPVAVEAWMPMPVHEGAA